MTKSGYLFALSLLIAALAVTTWAPICSASLTPPSLSDSDAVANAMRRLAGIGIIVGYPDGTARSEAGVTRYEFAAAWARLARKLALRRREVCLEQIITDVFDMHWARDSVELLAATRLLPILPCYDLDPMYWGITPHTIRYRTKKGDGRRYLLYDGDRPLLRGHYMEMAYRTFRIAAEQGLGGMSLRELEKATPMGFVVKNSIFGGFADRRLHLYRSMSRAEFFCATSRVVDLWDTGFSATPPSPAITGAVNVKLKRANKKALSAGLTAGTPGSSPSHP